MGLKKGHSVPSELYMGPTAKSMSRIETFAAEGLLVDEQIRFRHQIEPDGAHALPRRIGELMMMAEQVQAGPHGGQNLIEHGLARVDVPPRGIEGPGCLVREKDVD